MFARVPLRFPAVVCWVGTLGLAACGGGDAPSAPPAARPPAPASSIAIEAEVKSVGVGATLQLRATARDAQGNVRSEAPISWSSLDPSIATVSTSGLLNGVRAGLARIRATTGSLSDEAVLSVARAYSAGAPVEVTADTGGVAHVFTTSFGGLHVTVQVRTPQGSPVPGAVVGYSEQDGKTMLAVDGPDTTWASTIALGSPDSLRARSGAAPNVAVSTRDGVGPTVERLALAIEISPYQQVRFPFATDAYQLAKLFFHLGADNRRCMSYLEAAAFLKTRAALSRRSAAITFVGPTATTGTILTASVIREAGLLGADAVVADRILQIGLRQWSVSASHTVSTRVGIRSDFADPAKVGAAFRRFWEALVITPADATCQPATPAKLTFVAQPPPNGIVDANLSPAVHVAIQDAAGNTISSAANTITVALGQNTTGAVLSGTLTRAAVNGVATFSDLKVDKPGTYTLTVAGAGLTATSAPFVVSAATVPTGERLSSGHQHTCGITAAGSTYCWGFTAAWAASGVSGFAPGMIPGGLSFSSVAGGGMAHSCALVGSGAAYCWGNNSTGQLGDGTTSSATRSTPGPVAGSLVFTQLASGGQHTCGVSQSGAAYCWGLNNFGQLGDGTSGPTLQRLSPVPVSGGQTFTSVRASFQATCGLTSTGAAYCWGDNAVGQLGDGSTTTRLTPTPVSGGIAFRQLTALFNFVCGLTASGTAHCWGQNTAGQLGDGTTINRSSPVTVNTSLTFSTVAAGSDHVCGLTASGVAYCWGANAAGQLGDGTNTPRLQPTPVAGGLTFRSLTAGVRFTCGIATSGTVYCWGANNFGQLGDATNVFKTTPTPLFGTLVF